MILLIDLKKIRIHAVIILLFCLITAIIIAQGNGKKHTDVAVMAEAISTAPVLVIDAGHGGMDGGATAEDGTPESILNLELAQRTRALASLFGLRTVMTRESEDLNYPAEADTIRAKKVWDQKSRVELINSTEGAILLSIHQNKYPDPRPSGIQVLYADTEGSDVFAELTHSNLSACFCPESRRVAMPASKSIFLMKQVTCPAVLVECGFLSNPAEAKKLKNSSYQTALATALAASYLQYINKI